MIKAIVHGSEKEKGLLILGFSRANIDHLPKEPISFKIKELKQNFYFNKHTIRTFNIIYGGMDCSFEKDADTLTFNISDDLIDFMKKGNIIPIDFQPLNYKLLFFYGESEKEMQEMFQKNFNIKEMKIDEKLRDMD